MSDGNQHNLNNMPLIQAGSCGGYFKTGVAVNVDDGTADLHRGNSAAVCENPSSQITSSGTPAEFANAPINKYFCNLMNAIGVRAGKVLDKYKVAKHFDLSIAEASFAFKVNDDRVAAEAALDGL